MEWKAKSLLKYSEQKLSYNYVKAMSSRYVIINVCAARSFSFDSISLLLAKEKKTVRLSIKYFEIFLFKSSLKEIFIYV